MPHERLKLTDTRLEMFMKIAEGNPGGLTILLQLMDKSQKIDPDAALGPLAHIFSLDTLAIYGSRIWLFFRDVCKNDLVSMIAVMRAVQLGKLSESVLHHAIDHQGEGLDVKAIIEVVKKELPNFGK